MDFVCSQNQNDENEDDAIQKFQSFIKPFSKQCSHMYIFYIDQKSNHIKTSR